MTDRRYGGSIAEEPYPRVPRQGSDPERRPRHARRRPRRGWRVLRRSVLALVAAVAVVLAVSFYGAWRTPGNPSFNAKWADWMRAHHAAVIINPLERWYYQLQAPARGGRPTGLNVVPSVAGAKAKAPVVAAGPTHLPPPSAVPLVVSPALPSEGQWQPTGALVGGQPAMYVAQFRADTVYTSQITSAVWIDPTALKVRINPGARDPGGTWSEPPDLTGSAAAAAVAAFNGGFRFQDAQGGFYLDGRTAVPLRAGAASVVIYRGGRIDVGAWGSEVSMTPQVSAVLQNLVPLVDHGQIAPDATYSDTRIWGATLGASTVVARSGIGVTADGALVYVAGPALTAKTLAESLQRAGAVRAMTLDINPEWVTFNLFSHPNPADPAAVVGAKLYPQMQRSPTRYIGPAAGSRDFFSVSLR